MKSISILLGIILLSSIFTINSQSYGSGYFNDSLEDNVKGEQKLVFIPIEFTDLKHDPNGYDIEEVALRFENYYKENSYGKVWFDTKVLPKWYSVGKISSYENAADTAYNIFERGIIQNAVDAASGDIDFTEWNNVVLVFAFSYELGDDNLFLGTANNKQTVLVDGKELKISWTGVPYQQTTEGTILAIVVHEVGHFVFHLPDLYVGGFKSPWEPMFGGDHDDRDGGISKFSSWSKLRAGFLSEENVATVAPGEKRTITVKPLGLGPDGTLVIRAPITDGSYYLIEVREPVGFDQDLPKHESFHPDGVYKYGVFVIHVNEREPVSRGGVQLQWIVPEYGDFAKINTDDAAKAAFSVGDIFQNPSLGKMSVISKVGDSYEIEVDRISIEPANQVIPQTITLTTDKKNYVPGETVHVSGAISKAVVAPGKKLSFRVDVGSIATPKQGELIPNSDGTFSFDFYTLQTYPHDRITIGVYYEFIGSATTSAELGPNTKSSNTDIKSNNDSLDDKKIDKKSKPIRIDSPLKQFKSGIQPEKITCKEGLEIVIKTNHKHNPICVKHSTKLKMIQIGLAYATK